MARGPLKRPICPNRGLPTKKTIVFWKRIRRKQRWQCRLCLRVFEKPPRYHCVPPKL